MNMKTVRWKWLLTAPLKHLNCRMSLMADSWQLDGKEERGELMRYFIRKLTENEQDPLAHHVLRQGAPDSERKDILISIFQQRE